MQVYVNRSLDVQTVGKIRTECDLSYVPRVGYPLNRTVVNMANKIAVQLDINCNICEVIVDGNKIELFKALMLDYVVNFLIDSMKKMMPVKVLNEIGFKLNIYVPQSCDSNLFSNMVKSDILETSTVFSVPLSSPHHKFTLPLKLTEQYSLISPVPVQTHQFQNFTSQNHLQSQPQAQAQNQNITQQSQAQNQSFTQPQTQTQNFTQQPQAQNQSFTQQPQAQNQNFTHQNQTQNPFGNVEGPGFSFGTTGTPASSFASTNFSFGSQNPTTPQNNTQFGSFSQTSTTPFSGFGAFATQQPMTTPSFGNISTPPFTGFGSFK